MVCVIVHFRPHHVLCTIGFQGKGYSAAFVQNYIALKKELQDDTQVRIVAKTDDICSACPHQRDAQCTKEKKIQRLDARHAKALGLKEGMLYTWGTLFERVRQHVKPEDLDILCQGCVWLPFGVCQNACAKL